jgi:L-seryl-tRNA(Ser) seleniumtransferase
MRDLSGLPKVDVLAASEALDGFPDRVRILAAQRAIEIERDAQRRGEPKGDVLGHAVKLSREIVAPRLVPTINASGVVLHTGLGRARLAPAAVEAVLAAAASHVAVELDLASGKRGDRQELVRDLICSLTGAEDAIVVNNCASAVLLALSALAKGGEVILSRGQMVEIGGSFRMPDIVRRSGCKLVEVGCTNKTHLSDFEEAITTRTRAILRCHPSNFKVVGFVEEPSVKDLAELAHGKDFPLIDDVGSGCLVDTTAFGLPREPRFGESLREGADLALASGDKLLGGPQAGLIIGKQEFVRKLARHPLARAVRVDKFTLAGLSATLQLYVQGRESTIPTLKYLGRSQDEVRAAATVLASGFPGAVVDYGLTEIGGGSLPGVGVPTWRCGLPVKNADRLAQALRTGSPSVLARIEKGMVWLDPRTMEQAEVEATVQRLRELA